MPTANIWRVTITRLNKSKHRTLNRTLASRDGAIPD
jgi:hypothetical protein